MARVAPVPEEAVKGGETPDLPRFGQASRAHNFRRGSTSVRWAAGPLRKHRNL